MIPTPLSSTSPALSPTQRDWPILKSLTGLGGILILLSLLLWISVTIGQPLGSWPADWSLSTLLLPAIVLASLLGLYWEILPPTSPLSSSRFWIQLGGACCHGMLFLSGLFLSVLVPSAFWTHAIQGLVVILTIMPLLVWSRY